MKKVNLMGLVFLAFSLSYCGENQTQNETKISVEADAEKSIFNFSEEESFGDISQTLANVTIEGMMCAKGCAGLIHKKVANLEGVKEVEINFDEKMAVIDYDERKINHETIAKTINSIAGGEYTVTDFHIKRTKLKENTKVSENISKESQWLTSLLEETKKKEEAMSIPIVFPDIIGAIKKVFFPY